MKRIYIVEWFNVGYGGSIKIYGKIWTAYPWSKWVKVWHYLEV